MPAFHGDDTRRGAPHVRPQEQHDQLKAEIATLQQELATLQREEENLLRRCLSAHCDAVFAQQSS